jgi:DNA-binding transcriptional MerR regulator
MRELDIGEVAKKSGVPPSTLRYYDQRGLIHSVGRRGLRRMFEAGVLEKLALISLGSSAGFSLEDIARMFRPDGRLQIDRQKLAEKADELDRNIRKLTAMRNGLRHAAVCPAPSHLECPTFRRLIGLASVAKIKSKGRKS